jgi:hypothetical protein
MRKTLLGLTLGIALIILVLVVVNAFNHAYAQTTNTTATGQVPINLPKYFAENKEFQHCFSFSVPAGLPQCIPATDVLYQSATTLGLSSSYIDAIWKAVDFAKKYGYKIDGIATYTTRSESTGGTINVLVSMSR